MNDNNTKKEITILDKVNININEYRKEGNSLLLSISQLLKSKLQNNETAPVNQRKSELDIVKSLIKQTFEEIDSYTKANRFDKVHDLAIQKGWLETFLPTMYTRDEIWLTITDHFDGYDMKPKNIGEIMTCVKLRMDKDRLDGKLLSELAKEYLNNG